MFNAEVTDGASDQLCGVRAGPQIPEITGGAVARGSAARTIAVGRGPWARAKPAATRTPDHWRERRKGTAQGAALT